jgi:nucleotide-sensitive chloride channel 1A
MALRHLTTPPKADDFTPLQEHQEQTPTTFFGAKPVLYAHQSALTLVAPVGQLQTDPIFSKFSHNGSGHPGQDEQVRDVEIWVTSECVNFLHTMT